MRERTARILMMSRMIVRSKGFSTPFAADGHDHLLADRPAKRFDDFIQCQPEGLLSVDEDDQIARLDPRQVGRRAVDRRDDLQDAVLLGDLDPDAAELALGLDLHLFEIARRHVTGVRIERRQHSVDGASDQFRVVDILDIL